MTWFSLLLAISINTSIDSTMLFIGDQTEMHISVTADKGERVQMPVFGEYVIPGIEIVKRGSIDTTSLNDKIVQYTQQYTITSFNDSLFYIPPIACVCEGDSIFSDGLSLNVIQPFKIDTTLAITDIKGIMQAPRWIWGTLRWILLGVLLLGLGIGLYFLWRYVRSKRTGEPILKKAKPLRPAEEVALEKLAIIKEEKVWQSGQTKLYHTELTDVVREYIGRRFDVHSSEKTSQETLTAMKPILQDRRELWGKLNKMLTLADLVKFAKWTPTPAENEESLTTAYEFVNDTTVKETEAESVAGESQGPSAQNSLTSKIEPK